MPCPFNVSSRLRIGILCTGKNNEGFFIFRFFRYIIIRAPFPWAYASFAPQTRRHCLLYQHIKRKHISEHFLKPFYTPSPRSIYFHNHCLHTPTALVFSPFFLSYFYIQAGMGYLMLALYAKEQLWV